MDTMDFIFLVSGTTVFGMLAGFAVVHSITGARSARELAGEWMFAVGSGLGTVGLLAGPEWLGLVGAFLMVGGLVTPLKRLRS